MKSISGVEIYPKGQHPRDLRKSPAPVKVLVPEVKAAKAVKSSKKSNRK